MQQGLAEYEALLDRAYSALPERKASSERFELPRVDAFIEGNKTIVRNFEDVCKTLRRPCEDVSKYLAKKLAAPCVLEPPRAIFMTRLTPRAINERLEEYCKARVICKECGKPDTHYESIAGVRLLVCEACGARNPVRE